MNIYLGNSKGNVVTVLNLTPCHWGISQMEAWLRAFLTLAPDGGEWLASSNRERTLVLSREENWWGPESVCTVLRKIYFLCHKSNHGSSAVQATANINSSSSEYVTYDFKMLAACTNWNLSEWLTPTSIGVRTMSTEGDLGSSDKKRSLCSLLVASASSDDLVMTSASK